MDKVYMLFAYDSKRPTGGFGDIGLVFTCNGDDAAIDMVRFMQKHDDPYPCYELVKIVSDGWKLIYKYEEKHEQT